ncbi:MAG: type II secretion system protein [Cellulosilyticum sp.]|nr:type II secretion system protein [Cellulosilyticum sp.]
MRGYTLIEMVAILLLISVMSSAINIGTRVVDELNLQTKAKEIADEIEYTKQVAALTGQRYKVVFGTSKVWVQKDMNSPNYKIHLAPHQKFKMNISKSQILYFNGNFITGDANTIRLINEKIGKQAIITIGVATSKVNVYYEKYKDKKPILN